MKSVKDTSASFQFKQFAIQQDRCNMKVGTDGVLLGAWAPVAGAKQILDIGTGTGLIALMLGQRSPGSSIHAVEIDAKAAEQARENAQASPWHEQVEIVQAAIQDYQRQCDTHYDLIVSNPPFFSGGTFSANQDKNSVRHTIKLPHGDLLSAVRNLLKPDGKFCVILPLIEGLRFEEIAETYKLYCTRQTEVHPTVKKPVERLLMQFERIEKEKSVDSLTIQKGGRNEWTAEYIALTGDFYLKM